MRAAYPMIPSHPVKVRVITRLHAGRREGATVPRHELPSRLPTDPHVGHEERLGAVLLVHRAALVVARPRDSRLPVPIEGYLA